MAQFGACVVTCGADEGCDGSKKCCSNGCGSWCVKPSKEQMPFFSTNTVLCYMLHCFSEYNSTAFFGAKVWNCLPLEIRKLPRTAFKQKIRDLLFQILDVEDSYVDSPTLLNKIATYNKSLI